MRSGPSADYAILGALEARVDQRRVPLGAARQRAVLVCLLVRPNAVVPATRIVDEVWPDDPPATATNLIQGYVSNLRKTLGRAAIETEGAGYRIRVDSLDLLEFERLSDIGARALEDGRAEEAQESFRSALALWRGPALGDLSQEHSCSRLSHGSRNSGCLPASDSSRRSSPVVVRRCRRRSGIACPGAPAARAPARAADAGALRCGRQVEALQVYREGRDLLVAELGIEPGEELRELERQS